MQWNKKCKTIRCAKTVYWGLINSNMNKRDVQEARGMCKRQEGCARGKRDVQETRGMCKRDVQD